MCIQTWKDLAAVYLASIVITYVSTVLIPATFDISALFANLVAEFLWLASFLFLGRAVLNFCAAVTVTVKDAFSTLVICTTGASLLIGVIDPVGILLGGAASEAKGMLGIALLFFMLFAFGRRLVIVYGATLSQVALSLLILVTPLIAVGMVWPSLGLG